MKKNEPPLQLAVNFHAAKQLQRLEAQVTELREALEAFVSRWQYPKKPTGDELEIYLEQARAALAKTGGGT